MDKSHVRQQPPAEPTCSAGVSPMILLEWKADSLHIFIICLLGSLWACSVRMSNYSWKNLILTCVGWHKTPPWKARPFPGHICSSTAWPTLSCLKGSCIPNFHSESVHLPFPTSVSFYYTLLGEVLSKCHSPHNHRSAWLPIFPEQHRNRKLLPKILFEFIT